MKILPILALVGISLAAGAAAGYKFALTHEHDRLERNKAFVRRTHTDLWSEHDPTKRAQVARELYSTNFVVHASGADSPTGIEKLLRDLADTHLDFSDYKESVEAIAAEGDLVVARFVTTGTQARDLEAIPNYAPRLSNRGRTMRMQEMEMFRIVDGQLAEQWDLADVWNADAQLGLFDPDHFTESICGPKR